MQLNNTFAKNFSFASNFNNVFDKAPKTLSKVEEAIKPLVSKYGATDNNDISNINKVDTTSMDKLQNAVMEEDETITALDFVDENGDGIEDVDVSINSLADLLDGVTDETDLQGIQDEIDTMLNEIDLIAQNTYDAISKLAGSSEGISTTATKDSIISGAVTSRDSSFSVSIGDKEVSFDIMDMDSTSLGLRDIDITKEGGLDAAYDIINSAQSKLDEGLDYLSNVKSEITDTFEQYKSEVISDIESQLSNQSGAAKDDFLNQLQSIVIQNADLAVQAQLNQKPEAVLALV